jgi:hypothetical protein
MAKFLLYKIHKTKKTTADKTEVIPAIVFKDKRIY